MNTSLYRQGAERQETEIHRVQHALGGMMLVAGDHGVCAVQSSMKTAPSGW